MSQIPQIFVTKALLFFFCVNPRNLCPKACSGLRNVSYPMMLYSYLPRINLFSANRA